MKMDDAKLELRVIESVTLRCKNVELMYNVTLAHNTGIRSLQPNITKG